MAYYIDLFSPETYETFTKSDRTTSGFRQRQQSQASKVEPGDKLICYLTKLSRWVGVLEVTSEAFKDSTPLFLGEDDPFIIRFKVKPLVWLEKEKGVPIREDKVWNTLSFTKGSDKNSSQWTGKVRASLGQLTGGDGPFLEKLIFDQGNTGQIYEIDAKEYDRLVTHKVRREDKLVTVTVPQNTAAENEPPTEPVNEVRESIQMQALLAEIGAKMGMSIWIPRNDKAAVVKEWKGESKPLISTLPLNYDETTLKTIEQIDILWLKGRSIVRAFEVEHTTSIYSGILRMADLLALQPNINIKLHIVAPYARRDKVFEEIRRPVFTYLEKGPLKESCTYISYDSIRELSKEKHLSHLSDKVLDEFAEEAD